MSPETFLSTAVAGLGTGALYALLAAGLALTLRVARTVNLAHGDLVVLGGYGVFWLGTVFGYPFWLVVPVCALAGGLGGAVIWAATRRLPEPRPLYSLVLTFGFSMLLQGLYLAWWRADYRLVTGTPLQGGLRVADLNLPAERVVAGTLGLLSLGLLHLFLTRTYPGLILRATSSDPVGAALLGVRTHRVELAAFLAGGAVAAFAGIWYSLIYVLYPAAGVTPTIIGLVLTMLAGQGPLGRVALAGLGLGLAEAFATLLLGLSWRELVAYGALFAVLLARSRPLHPGQVEPVADGWRRESPPRGLLPTLLTCLILTLLLLAPAILPGYIRQLLTGALIFAGLGLSWLVLRWAGPVSFGHAAFVGLGAYISATAVLRLGFSPWQAILVAGLSGAVLAVPLGAITLKLSGPDLALASLALVPLLKLLVLNLEPITGGSQGLVGIPPLTLPGLDGVPPPLTEYYAALAAAGLTAIGLLWLQHSAAGWAIAAVREDPVAADHVGINPARARLLALTVSATIACLIGGILAHSTRYLEPGLAFDYRFSLLPLVMAQLGGAGGPAGTLLTALSLYLLSELILAPALPYTHQAVYGLVLLGVMVITPGRPVVEVLLSRRQLLPAKELPGEPAPIRLPLKAGTDLICKGLGRRFDGLLAVDDVSLTLSPGNTLGLTGPNGSGKTTLLDLISGACQPERGQVTWGGRDITTAPPHRRCRWGLARTFQVVRPFRGLTVRENVRLALIYGGRLKPAAAAALADEVLAAVGLRAQADRLAGELSLGQQRLVEFARALATCPAVLLLDEVSAGLSPAARRRVIGLIRQLSAAGVSVLQVEHSLRVLRESCGHVLVMNRGRLIASGAPDDLAEDPAMLAVYLGTEGEEAS